jgi:TyrR family helix-turn-helix protein
MAQRGEFREDLFYRLNVLNIEIPPLRDRASDIPLLVEHFTARAATQIAQTQPKITNQAMKLLCQFSWPGNIRQLENLLFRSIALLDGNILDTEALQLPQIDTQRTQHNQTNEVQDWQSAQQQFEKALLNQLYPQYPSTRKLAKRLGVSHNKIAMKLKEHDIEG